jgi:hypothetical protein
MSYDKNKDSSMSGLSPKEEMLLKFMSTTIERINSCLINIHALQTLLIKKGVFTQNELCSEVSDAEDAPRTAVGKRMLLDMVKDFNVSNLTSMLETKPSGNSTGLSD